MKIQENQIIDIFDKRLCWTSGKLYCNKQPDLASSTQDLSSFIFLSSVGQTKCLEWDDGHSKKFAYTSESLSSYSIKCMGYYALEKATAIQSFALRFFI